MSDRMASGWYYASILPRLYWGNVIVANSVYPEPGVPYRPWRSPASGKWVVSYRHLPHFHVLPGEKKWIWPTYDQCSKVCDKANKARMELGEL